MKTTMKMTPAMLALGVNHDGVIDADEIANASAALKKLDKNGDGKLTPREFAPRPPRHGRNSSNGGDHSLDDASPGPSPNE